MPVSETPRKPRRKLTGRAVPDAAAGKIVAWEQIEEGRYMPRRIRGSFPGRELG